MNENDEAQYVAARILEDYSQGRHWKDHAVLYRMNAQSNQVEQAFKRNGIPYRIIGGTRFFDRAEVKDMIAYLARAEQPGGRPAPAAGSSTTRPVASGPRRWRPPRRSPGGRGCPSLPSSTTPRMYPELDRAAAKLAQFSGTDGRAARQQARDHAPARLL